MKVNKEEILLAIDATSSFLVSSISDPVTINSDDDSLTIQDTIVSNKNEENDIVDKITIKELLDELNSCDRQIVMLRYFKGITQTEVAKKLKISQVQVSRIEKKILNIMREKLIS